MSVSNVSTISPIPTLGRQTSAPIHHAIDRLTAALLDVQHLRRQIVAQDGAAAELDRLESTLQELGGLLLEIRESST